MDKFQRPKINKENSDEFVQNNFNNRDFKQIISKQHGLHKHYTQEFSQKDAQSPSPKMKIRNFEQSQQQSFNNSEGDLSQINDLKKHSQYGYICLVSFLILIVGGQYANSIAVTQMSLYLLADFFGFQITDQALKFLNVNNKEQRQAGIQITELYGTITTLIFIWASCLWLILESLYRKYQINEFIMIIASFVGLVLNLIILKIYNNQLSFLKRKENLISSSRLSKRNLDNVDEGDVSSINTSREEQLQNSSSEIKSPIAHVIGKPFQLNVQKFKKELQQIVGLLEIRDLHIWSISSGKTALSCILISNQPIDTRSAAEHVCRKFGIQQITIQILEKDPNRELDERIVSNQ